MTAVVEQVHIDRSLAPLGDQFHLSGATVFIQSSLDREARNTKVINAPGDVPIPETRVEPRLIPTQERVLRIGVILSKSFGQIRFPPCDARVFDAADRKFFHKEMRCQ